MMVCLAAGNEAAAAHQSSSPSTDKVTTVPSERISNNVISGGVGTFTGRYSIGALLPRGGRPELVSFGDRALKGAELAVRFHNDAHPANKVALLVRDTEGSAEKAIAAMTALAAQGVIAVVGPLLNKEVEAVAPLLERQRIPAIRPAASRSGLPRNSGWMFMSAMTIETQARMAAEFAEQHQYKRIAVLYPDTQYGKDLSRLFVKMLEGKASIVGSIGYPPETRDFGPYVKRIPAWRAEGPDDSGEAKKVRTAIDALYLPGNAEQVGLLLPHLAFNDIAATALIGSDAWHSPELMKRAGRRADGAVFFDGYFPESTDLFLMSVYEAYRTAYQEEPDIVALQTFDAVAMILSQLQEKTVTTSAQIRDGLLGMHEYPGVSGLTSFDGGREARKKLFTITVRDGEFVAVDE